MVYVLFAGLALASFMIAVIAAFIVGYSFEPISKTSWEGSLCSVTVTLNVVVLPS